MRDESESHYVPGTQVEVYTLETDQKVCEVKILSVKPLHFDDINEFHAEQEYIELPKLKKLIREIYPDTDTLFRDQLRVGLINAAAALTTGGTKKL
ncbi:N(4)-acetylcytidine aminohydrolase [Vibrio sinaloensis]|nr:N(4)-acetylcytidine aminohydrolase [Vibrio sinaloensis]